jgi:hypothetical protein
MRIFIVGAIVLIIFAIIGGAASSLTFLSVQWYIWFMASFLSFLVDLLWPVTLGSGGVTVVRTNQPVQ